MADHGGVGGVSARKRDRVLTSNKLTNLLFQLLVNRPRPRYQSTRRHAGPVKIQGLFRRVGDRGVTRHSQVVVPRIVDQLAAIDPCQVIADSLVNRKKRISLSRIH